MVQEFHVLQCFSCQSFQVQQEFGRGSGADCRRHVQKLNATRGAKMEEQEHHTWSLWKQVEADGEDEPKEDDQVSQAQVSQAQGSQSRWSKYLGTPEEAEPEEDEEENVVMDRQQLRGNNMIDRNRKRKRVEGWTDAGGQDSWTPE
ncbi:MRN complex-interacting protein isoform X3 [Sebastes umbrosus]|uniref:MRN complex-interacting protein isoform X3 n=1 Tax=Sebastes umbrosus TaxID=72105 RepID=UPI00189DDD92|nr:MRN complex-interacting protein isoform X3 [Sebastes umbrosus]